MARRLFFKETGSLGVAPPGYSVLGFNTDNRAIKTDESGVVRLIESVYTDESNTIVIGASGGTGSVSVNGYYELPNYAPLPGKVLGMSGSSLAWIDAGGGGGLQGSGTTNYLAKWNGSSLTGSLVYDNGINIGIGTNTPNAVLNIYKSNNSHEGIRIDNPSNTSLAYASLTLYSSEGNLSGIFKNSNTNTFYGGVGSLNVIDFGDNSLTLGTNGMVRLLVNKSNGFVGIGNAALTPTSMLYVKGSGTSSGTYAFKVENLTGLSLISAQNDGGVGVNINNPTTYFQAHARDTAKGAFSVTADYYPYTLMYIKGAGQFSLGGSCDAFQTLGFNFAMGYAAVSNSGDRGLAIGYVANAGNLSHGDGMSVAIGHYTYATGRYSSVFGSYVSANQDFSMAIGMGNRGTAQTMNNTTPNTIAFGMKSDIPTMYVHGGDGSNGVLGKVSIGTSSVSAMLHVKSGSNLTSDYALKVDNFSNTALLYVRNDGSVWANGKGGSTTNTVFGLNAGINFDLSGGAGIYNTYYGWNAGVTTTTGWFNTAYGAGALRYATIGGGNVAMGYSALTNLIDGGNNIAVGSSALISNISGSGNVAIGRFAAFSSLSNNNVAIGFNALESNVNGSSNVAIGLFSLKSSTGTSSVAIGANTGYLNTSGNNNTLIGAAAGYSSVSGTDNLFIGYNAGYFESGSNKLFIDNQSRGSENGGRSNSMIYGEFNSTITSQKLSLNAVTKLYSFTATEASAISAEDGQIIYVNSTNGTFTQIGFWGRENGAWIKL